MKIVDRTSGTVVCDIMTNHSMSIDDALSLMRISVTDDGQLHDDDTDTLLDAWYDDLDMIY